MSSGEKRRGEKNGRSKLTWEFLDYARPLWKEKKVSSYELSYEADVSQSTMHNALTEKTWKPEGRS